MAQVMLAAGLARQGTHNPDADSDEEEELITTAKGTKLKRRPDVPTDVYSWFEITLQDINVPTQEFACSTEMHVFWQDYNLPNVIPDWEEKGIEIHYDSLPIKMTEIFENKTSISNDEPEFKYYPNTGTLHMKLVVDCTFVERMELQRFPLDRQFMNMAFNAMIEPALDGEGKWNWILEFPEWMPEELKSFDKKFAVRMLSSVTEYELLEPWVDFNCEQPLSIRLRVNRLPAFYFGNIVFPNFLIVAGAFASFAVPADEIADRLSVTVTLMLAAVAFMFIVSTMLPKVSYLTVMDYYILVGFGLLMLMIAENAIAGIEGFTLDYSDDIDLWFAIILGSVWFGIHLVALVALLRKECLRVTWEEMDAIDQAEDDEAEFVFADPNYVNSKTETTFGQEQWRKYKKFDVLERADLYARDNGIKRSDTFAKKFKKEQQRKATENFSAVEEEEVEETKEQEKAEGQEAGAQGTSATSSAAPQAYVPSKIEKVADASPASSSAAPDVAAEEEQMANHIELTEAEKEKDVEVKAEMPVMGDEPRQSHGYTETVLVNADEAEVEQPQSPSEMDDEEAEVKPLKADADGDADAEEEEDEAASPSYKD